MSKERGTLPMPTYTDVAALGMVIAHAGRLPLLVDNSKVYSRDIHITIETNEKQNEVSVIFISKAGKTVVTAPIWSTGVSTSKSCADKLFTFLLCKIAEESHKEGFENEIQFRLTELVDCGIFSSVLSARKSFKEILHYLKKIQLSSSRRVTRSNIGENDRILFHYSDIRKGVCYVGVSNRFDWQHITEPYINMSKALFAASPLAMEIAKAVYRYIRTDCKTEKFVMPLGYVIAKSGVVIDSTNPGRTINSILKAIDEINQCADVGFTLISRIKKGKNVKDSLLHSAIVVVMHGRLITDMERVSLLRAKRISESGESSE